MTVAEADEIKDRLEQKILAEKGITDVLFEFDEDDGVLNWFEKEKATNESRRG